MQNRIRRIVSWLRFAVVLLLAISAAAPGAELGVSSSGHFLTLQNKPFFWLGDTVWLLAQVPSRDEVELYLRTRADQGFTVIQLTAVMGEERVWDANRATSQGDMPFVDHDVMKPAVTPGSDPADPVQYDYWDHFDYVLERIHAHGLRAAVVPYFVGWRGDGYNYLKPENAQQYGHFLGERCRNKPEVFWVLGGDNTPKTDSQKAVWNLLAKGLAEGLTGKEDYAGVVMTYHINGGASSAQVWHDSAWLDFNMAQTWATYTDIHPAVLRDYQRVPARPCGLGEGAYEDGPQYPTKPINALVVRRQACWSWFAGGYHTYGNGNVWHFDTVKAELTQPWKPALHSSGAESLRHCRHFLEKIGWWKLTPEPSVIAEGAGSGATRNVAMLSAERDAIAAYLAAPGSVKLRLDRMTRKGKLTAKWTNPATGEELAATVADREASSFTAPAGWSDALLYVAAVRDDASLSAERPGSPAITADNLVSPDQYFPPSESNGGWRVLTTPGQIRSTAGVDPDKLQELREWLLNSDKRNFAAVVIRNGYIVLQVERGNSASRDSGRVASVSKAVCATVLAIASEWSQQGRTPRRMSFGDRAFDFIPWAQPLSDPRKAQITVQQLLNHTSGICPEATGAPNDGSWEYILGHTGDARTARLAFDPGQGCGYSTHALAHAALVCETVTGKPYDTFAIEALFKPLGIERWSFQYYDGGPNIGPHPSHGLGMPARDLARIAYCMLRGGRWGTQQIIPQRFVDETAAPTQDVKTLEMRWKLNPEVFSHGWELPARHRAESGRSGAGIPRDARSKPGSGGQLIAFVPSLDLVITRQTGSSGEWQFEEYLRRACAVVLPHQIKKAGQP